MSKGTDRRTVRIAPELWERAGRIAVSNGENLSDVIRRALEQYEPKLSELAAADSADDDASDEHDERDDE